MIWEDDANTSYRKGEKIRIDLYAKSTDGGADRLVKSQEVTPTENESFQNFAFDNLQIAENGVYIEYYAKEIFEDVDGWTIVNKVDRRREKNQKSSSN